MAPHGGKHCLVPNLFGCCDSFCLDVLICFLLFGDQNFEKRYQRITLNIYTSCKYASFLILAPYSFELTGYTKWGAFASLLLLR